MSVRQGNKIIAGTPEVKLPDLSEYAKTDLNNLTQAGKDVIKSNGMRWVPRYDAGFQVPKNTEYTSPADGVYIANGGETNQWPSQSVEVLLSNGKWANIGNCYTSTGDYAGALFMFAIINKDYKYRFKGTKNGTIYPF